MVARGVDGLAIAPVERKSLVAPVERAAAAGIPVTVYDSGLDWDKYMCFVATNNYEAGQMAARKLGELMGGKGEVVALMRHPACSMLTASAHSLRSSRRSSPKFASPAGSTGWATAIRCSPARRTCSLPTPMSQGCSPPRSRVPRELFWP